MNRALRASYRFCAELSRREARNFYYSFLVLPPTRRRAMCALYAFMRHTDDLADRAAPSEERRAALLSWRDEVHGAIEQGEPGSWPGLPALVATVTRYQVPLRHLGDVLDGVTMDLEPQPFRTFEDLYVYCYRVASAVGLCCLAIWGYRSENGRAEALAEANGVALQLTNILRDVREDALNGRIYLPFEDLERFGVQPEELACGTLNDRLGELFAFEAERAYSYYDQARPLCDLVAPAGRPMLGAITGIYRALLDEIVRRDFDVLSSRISLPAWRKAAITVRWLAWWLGRPRAARNDTLSPSCSMTE